MQKDQHAGSGPRWDRYEDLLLDAMQVLPLDADSRARGPVYRALYQPAFHADTCVTIYDQGHQGVVEVVVASAGVRVLVMQQIGVRFGPGPQSPAPAGDLQSEAAEVPMSALLHFRQAVAGLDWAALATAIPDRGRDGFTVRGEVGTSAAVYRFHTWSPSVIRHPEAHRYCVAILTLALASTREAPTRSALRDLDPYLR